MLNYLFYFLYLSFLFRWWLWFNGYSFGCLLINFCFFYFIDGFIVDVGDVEVLFDDFGDKALARFFVISFLMFFVSFFLLGSFGRTLWRAIIFFVFWVFMLLFLFWLALVAGIAWGVRAGTRLAWGNIGAGRIGLWWFLFDSIFEGLWFGWDCWRFDGVECWRIGY